MTAARRISGFLPVRFASAGRCGYDTDVRKLRTVLLAVAAGHPGVLTDSAPTVFFDSFGDSSLNFELAIWTQDRAQVPRSFHCENNFSIERSLRENGSEITFPQRAVHLRTGPPAAPR
jgi:small-conductance mechanosensitive channel